MCQIRIWIETYLKKSPLLQGLKIHKVSDVIELQELPLFRMAMLSNSRTSSFYRHIWDNIVTQSKINGKGKSLLDGVQATFTQREISLIQYTCIEDYTKKI